MKKYLFILCFVYVSVGMYAQVNEQINIDLNKITVELNGNFVNIFYPDAELMDEIGNPSLPFITRSFVVPLDAEVTKVKINSVTKEKLQGNFNVYPSQEPIPTSLEYISGNFVQNKTLYNSTNSFPSDKVKILFDGFVHGYHIITVGMYPFEYIPLNKEIYVCNINFSLTYSISR